MQQCRKSAPDVSLGYCAGASDLFMAVRLPLMPNTGKSILLTLILRPYRCA
jgi:hypothetical protein